MTRVAVLTPPGTGAIATVAVSGPRAWELARGLFQPAGPPLPELPELNRFWFGTLGNDEVILAITDEAIVEIHCHGGRRVVRWVVEQFIISGCVEGEPAPSGPVLPLLQCAPTLRTASILLDQHHGAFDNAVRGILASPNLAGLAELARYSGVGRHLVEPWKVVVAGPPNVGKSSLVNALAGYQRAVVSEVAGTTRDVVSVQVAFDGWPVELTDTAGLREAEGLEAEGIERARRVLSAADLVLYVMDASAEDFGDPDPDNVNSMFRLVRYERSIWVMNKWDRALDWPPDFPAGAIRVSAVTGEGLPALASDIAYRLVPGPPPSGAAVPYTPQLADQVEAAHAALTKGNIDEAVRLLRDALG